MTSDPINKVKHSDFNQLEKWASNILSKCARLQPGEKVVIIYDSSTVTIASAILKAAHSISRHNTIAFCMEDYGNRNNKSENALKFPEEIADALKSCDVSLFIASKKKGELESFRTPMLKCIEKNKRIRHLHMPGIEYSVIENDLNTEYSKVSELSEKLFSIVRNARTIRVITAAGTDFTAEFSPKIKWLIDSGIIEKGSWANLPAGEVFTCIDTIKKGTIVIDGCIGDALSDAQLLEKSPVTLTIDNSRITSIKCRNKKIVDELKAYVSKDSNSNRIGEFAIGTNIYLKKLLGIVLHDEKVPGLHVSIGHGYPKKTGSKWDSKAHADCVIIKPTIIVNEKQIIMKKGKFTIEKCTIN